MSEWYMSVGFPGGDFACRAESLSQAWHELWPSLGFAGAVPDYEQARSLLREQGAQLGFETIRPCPPELVEWIESGMGHWCQYPMQPLPDGTGQVAARQKVPGGWLYCTDGNYTSGTMHTTAFVPIRGADGLAVVPGVSCPSCEGTGREAMPRISSGPSGEPEIHDCTACRGTGLDDEYSDPGFGNVCAECGDGGGIGEPCGECGKAGPA